MNQTQTNGQVTHCCVTFSEMRRVFDLKEFKFRLEAMKKAYELAEKWNQDVGKLEKDVFLC